MPSIGNGQLSTGVYTDTVYMNGLYNGELGESHRARIPSQINIRMSIDGGQTVTQQRFILDTEKGNRFFYILLLTDILFNVYRRSIAFSFRDVYRKECH